MALVIKHSIDAISKDCVELTFIDNTGLFDVADNPGGYGSPNKERNTLVAFLAVFAFVQDGDDDRLDVDNSQAVTADTWIVDTTRDGYVYSTLLLIDIYSPTQPDYPIDSIVYENAIYYKALIANGTDSSVVPPSTSASTWEVVPDPYEERANVQEDQIGTNDDVTFCRVDICYAEEISRVNAGKCCTDCTRKSAWIKIDVLRQGAQVECERLLFRESDLIVQQIQNECESLECVACNPKR